MRICLILTAAVSLALSALAPCAAETRGKDGVVVDQLSKFGGEYIVTATSDALKITRGDGHLTVITKAPDWKIFVLNNEDLTCFETTYTKFAGGVMGNIFINQLRDFNAGRWRPMPDEVIYGALTKKYSMSKRVIPQQIDQRFQLEHYSLSKATAYFLPAPELSPAAAAVVGRILVSPERFCRVALRLDYVDGNGQQVEGLRTKSMRKEIISASTFAVPRNYKRVLMEDAVYHDKKSDASLENAFDWAEHVDRDMADKSKLRH